MCVLVVGRVICVVVVRVGIMCVACVLCCCVDFILVVVVPL